jgi:spore maturation protein CgeB
MSCGGFLITNYQEELMEYFEPGTDLVIYEDVKDLAVKTEYYLAHDDLRRKIAQNGHDKVAQLFGFTKRLESIIL